MSVECDVCFLIHIHYSNTDSVSAADEKSESRHSDIGYFILVQQV